MTKQEEIRKLAAVMFTDLVGYTSMFQQDEASALHKIQLHRHYLEEITIRYHGTIIQFYGDGSLVVFDSAIDAVRSAIEIQQASEQHQIPVRVGIHVGDVIYQEEDVFGDAVNIASRIQSVGVPGSIVVSRKVADEFKGHPDLTFVALGKYSLKNVDERLELFAISGYGLSTPTKQHSSPNRSKPFLYVLIGISVVIACILLFNPGFLKTGLSGLQEARIVIPPFTDLTKKPELSLLGDIASSIITYDLYTSSNADVVSVTSGLLYTNADMASMINNPAIARQTGAAHMIKGSYSLTGANKDSLMFWAQIVDTRTNQILPVVLPKIYCSANDHMDCIREMSGAIKGYWRSKGDQVFSYPNNNAYIAYLRARKLWAHPEDSIRDKAKAYLVQSIGYDSMFLDAYFLLLEDFSNKNEFHNERDTIELIKNRFSDLTPRQENFLQYYEEELYGRNLKVYDHFKKEYVHDPKDLFLNTTGSVLAIEFLNDPATALRFLKDLDADSLDLRTCAYCRTWVNMAMQAYAELSDKNNADRLAEKLKPYAETSGQFTRLIAYYMNTEDTASVNDIINRLAQKADEDNDDAQFACLMAGRYAMINDNHALRDHYADRAITMYGPNTNRTLGRCFLLKDDLVRAEQIFLEEIEKKPNNKSLYADLGCVYAKQGNVPKSNEIIARLNELKTEYDLGQTPYFQGRIKALLGEKEAAIQYLTLALDEGIKFRVGTTFQHDPDLMTMDEDKNYQALLMRNRQL